MRFRREVEAAGRLKHPNVVAALDADEDRGVHFLVMDFVEGRDLDRVVRQRGPLAVKEAIDCLIQAARGLEAAHAQGIIHRDIKPANLMLDTTGTIRVLDLGLARIVDSANPFNKTTANRLTESGMYMGTVDYMAPEQAEDSHRVDHRADIYSLGCALYYLLTGREPFPGETVLKRLIAHMERTPPCLRDRRPESPQALEDTYQRMLAKRPADRPATMTEVIALLEAARTAPLSAGRPVQAAPPKSKAELKVFDEPRQKRPGTPQPKTEPSIFARPTEAEGLGINADLNLEDLIMDVRSEPRPEPLPRRARPMAGAQPLKRSGQLSYVRRTPRTAVLIAAAGAIATLAAGLIWFVTTRGERSNTPPGTELKTAATDEADRSKKKEINDGGGQAGPVAPFQDEFHTIFDGTTAAGWMLCDKKPLPRSHVQLDGLNPHGTGSYLVVYQDKLSDFVLDFDYKLEKGCNSGVFLRVSDLRSPVKTGLEVALDDTTGHGLGDSGAFFDLVAPETNAQKPAGQTNHMTITAQGPDITVALNGRRVSTIHLDEWTSPGKRPDGSNHEFANVAIASLVRRGYVGFQDLKGNCWFNHIRLKRLSPGGVSSPGTLVKKDAQSGTPVPPASTEPYVETARFTGHGEWVQSVYLLPDGKRLLSTSYDKSVRLWDIATGREIRRIPHPAVVLAAALVPPDARRVITGCDDGVVRLWDLESGKLIRSLVKHQGRVQSVAVSADGARALSGGVGDKTLRILDVEKGGEIRHFEGVANSICSVAFSPNGQRVVAGGDRGAVYLGNVMTSDPVQLLSGHSNQVWGIAFLPNDNSHAISGEQDGRLICWDLDQKRALRQVTMDDARIAAVLGQADGRRVIFAGRSATVGTQGVLGEWDMTTGAPPRMLVGGGQPHTGLALLPHGAIATADIDGLARIWEPFAALARARELLRSGKCAEALPEYNMAVGRRPSDPRLLIERGRLLATLGQSDKATADFEAAAKLVPDDPQLFLDAGWWVAGPYPGDYSQAGALENGSATDPSQPAPSLGNKSLRWHEVTPGRRGFVDFIPLFNVDYMVGYAMTVVYSTRPRELIMLIGSDDTAWIRLNGREIFLSKSSPVPDSHAIFATLQAGRNTIVVKVRDFVARGHSFSLRFGDSPADHAFAYAQAGKWKDAVEAFNKAMATDPENWDHETQDRWVEVLSQGGRWKELKGVLEKIAANDPGNFGKQQNLSRCYLALRDRVAYERLCTAALARYGKTPDRVLANNVIWLFALMPDVLRNYSEVEEIGRKLTDGKNPSATNCKTFGAILYRVVRFRPP